MFNFAYQKNGNEEKNQPETEQTTVAAVVHDAPGSHRHLTINDFSSRQQSVRDVDGAGPPGLYPARRRDHGDTILPPAERHGSWHSTVMGCHCHSRPVLFNFAPCHELAGGTEQGDVVASLDVQHRAGHAYRRGQRSRNHP